MGDSEATTLWRLHPSRMTASHSHIDRVPLVNLPSLHTPGPPESTPSHQVQLRQNYIQMSGRRRWNLRWRLNNPPHSTCDRTSTVMRSGAEQLCKEPSWSDEDTSCFAGESRSTVLALPHFRPSQVLYSSLGAYYRLPSTDQQLPLT